MKLQKVATKNFARTSREVAQMLARIPLYQDYGMTVPGMTKIVRRAFNDRNSDVRVVMSGHGESSRCVGFIWIQKHAAFARSAYLRLLAVDLSAHRGGIGRELMAWAEAEYLKPNGLFLLMSSRNAQARKFYSALGYRRVGQVKDYVKKGFTEEIWLKK